MKSANYFNKNNNSKGDVTPALLVIAGVAITILYALVALLAIRVDYAYRDTSRSQALHVAESGINRYIWRLTEIPNDFTDGTGGTGPYIHEVKDPEGKTIGSYELSITPPPSNSTTVKLVAKGWETSRPGITRIITAEYGRSRLTDFSFLHNENLWFGNEVTINGPVFSNGGIRMDGTNTSTVTSAKSTYTCGLETGCTSPTEKPGVWGNGKNSSLWSIGTTAVDFDSITINYTLLKSSAQSSGLYLPPTTSPGYHITFNSNGSYTVKTVTSTDYHKSYAPDDGCINLYQVIKTESAYGSYTIGTKPLIFVEDDAWVDGIVNGKATVVVTRLPVDTNDAVLFIPNNLTYLAKNGQHSLGLIARKDIIFTRDVPEDFEVDGALLAQKGKVIRHHYNYFDCKNPGPDKMKKSLTIYGSIITNKRAFWNFSEGPKSPACGFVKTTITYDNYLKNTPPVQFPSYGPYTLLTWDEK
jgi:hypothetical protein